MLLIHPPFSMPDKPYIGLPVLAGHLVECGIQVRLWDANLAFFRKALKPERLRLHFQEIRNRLSELDRLRGLTRPQASEYRRLAVAAGLNQAAAGQGFPDLFNDTGLANRRRMERFSRFLLLAVPPGGSESLTLTENTGYLRYRAAASFFSSAAMIPESRRPDSLVRRTLAGELARVLAEAEPAMAGISVTFPDQILPALTLAAMIREHRPGLPVVLGGAFVTVHMLSVRNPELFDSVDILAIGHGEGTLPALHDLLVQRRRPVSEATGIPGLILRGPDGVMATLGTAPLPKGPMARPAYGLFPLGNYLVPPSSAATLFNLSRGCYWARCAFCNCLSPVIQQGDGSDAGEVCDRLFKTIDETGTSIVHFTDDAADPVMLTTVAERLAGREPGVSWTVNVRADRRLTLDRLMLFRRSGCFSLFLGVETFNDRLLSLMNKGTTCALLERVLTDIAWAGISANIYMMVGFPTETEDEALASFERVSGWVRQGLVRQVIYSLFSITPQSPVARDPARFGVVSQENPGPRDLLPPVTRFECRSGMDRKMAVRLYLRFQKELAGPAGQEGARTGIVPWPGDLRYTFQAIKEMMTHDP